MKNYYALEITQFIFEISIIDYIEGVKVTYIPEGGGEVAENVVPIDYYTNQYFQVDGLIIDVEVLLVEELALVYSPNIYTDRTYTTLLYDNMTVLNAYNNELLICVETSSGEIDERSINFELTFAADTNDDEYSVSNQVIYSTAESTIKSINVEQNTINFYNNSNMTGVIVSCEVGYVEVSNDGKSQFVFSNEGYELKEGVNERLIKYNYIYNGETYSYVRSINVVYSVDVTNHFRISYTGENGEEIAYNNSLYLADVTMADILGDNLEEVSPLAAIERICESINVVALTNAYEEVAAERYVLIENGNAYFVIVLKEKKSNGSDGPGLNIQIYNVVETGDETGDETEKLLYAYINLKFNFDIDYDTYINIFGNGEVERNADGGVINIKTGEVMDIIARNDNVVMMILTADEMAGLEEGISPTDVEVFYGEIYSYVFDEVGEYYLIVIPTNNFFAGDGLKKEYLIIVEQGTGDVNDGVEDDGIEEFLGYDFVTFVYNNREDFIVSQIDQAGEFAGDFILESAEEGLIVLVAGIEVASFDGDTFVFDGVAFGNLFEADDAYFSLYDANSDTLINVEPYNEMDDVYYMAFDAEFAVVDGIITAMVVCYEDEAKLYEIGSFVLKINIFEIVEL